MKKRRKKRGKSLFILIITALFVTGAGMAYIFYEPDMNSTAADSNLTYEDIHSTNVTNSVTRITKASDIESNNSTDATSVTDTVTTDNITEYPIEDTNIDPDEYMKDRYTWLGTYLSFNKGLKREKIVITWDETMLSPKDFLVAYLKKGTSIFYSLSELDTYNGIAVFDIERIKPGNIACAIAVNDDAQNIPECKCYLINEDEWKNLKKKHNEQSLDEIGGASYIYRTFKEMLENEFSDTKSSFSVIDISVTKKSIMQMMAAQMRSNNTLTYNEY